MPVVAVVVVQLVVMEGLALGVMEPMNRVGNQVREAQILAVEVVVEQEAPDLRQVALVVLA
jgi:hypothetical protein